MVKTVLVFVIMSVSNSLGVSNLHLETRVVQGAFADIKDFGYAAYLSIACDLKTESTTRWFSCGSSILNHKFLLTAAHCLADCEKSSFISVNVGSAHKSRGIKKTSSKFSAHKKYGFPSMACDIGLVKLNEFLEFGSNVYRIVLMKYPPNEEDGVVSGWGLIDEIDRKRGRFLKYAKQRLWRRSDCQKLIRALPKGSFCAGELEANSYASFGDSGGALVVRNSTQIGIVSYKITAVSRSLSVYTNASFFYNWIQMIAKLLNCPGNSTTNTTITTTPSISSIYINR